MYIGKSDLQYSGSKEEDESKLYFLYPNANRLCSSANLHAPSYSSDSSLSDGQLERKKRRNRRKQQKPVLLAPLAFRPPLEVSEAKKLLPSTSSPPPVGIFWDIENCHVPKNKSATNVVQVIRNEFCKRFREAEFMVVCDVKKENAQVIQDLHDAQVNLIHVQSTSKNAADEKLRQSLRRYAEIYQPPAAAVLISSDINFSGDLSELRYRKKLHVILVHNVNVADALKLCADETYLYSMLMENVPCIKSRAFSVQYADLLVSNLPINFDRVKVKTRLKQLSDNCGGRVYVLDPENGTAVIRFSSIDYANRAQKRLKGEDVYGFKIEVMNTSRESPIRNFQPRKLKNSEGYSRKSFQNNSCFSSSEHSFMQQHGKDSWRYSEQDQYKQQHIGIPEANGIHNYKSSASSTGSDHIWKPHDGAFVNFRNRTIDDDLNSASSLHSKSKFNSSSYPSEKNFYGHNNSRSSSNHEPVELIISNLDPSIDLKDMGNILKTLLENYVVVQSLSISIQPDGMPVATVKVPSHQEAQFTISQLHHHKLGYKRLTISYAQNNSLDPLQLREMVVSLLQEVPGNRMPLFKLLELLESRFHINVSVSEVNKLKDVCKISDDLSGRIISLVSDIRSSPPNLFGRTSALYCSVHCPNGIENKGWGEPEFTQLPNITMPFKLFAQRLNDLLTSHLGTLPLLSLPMCYEAEFGEPLPIDEAGVPLEHLVTCVNNIELKYGGPSKNVKYVKRELKLRSEDFDEETMMKNVSPSIVANIKLLCRELVDLLKTTERCQILLNRFIPFYHHHFGRQCRVANYGYTKLVDLLESQVISSVVQILGEGQKRTITLTHSTQMRRFTSDLLRVLKGQVSKQITINELPGCYERAMSKSFSAVEYGLCYLEDLLEELPENTVVITKSPDSVIISIPKREQTAEEIMRTKQFADEVVKLLRFSPQCSMLFNKFVPAYHHHFGHQCKVSDYGFTKLIELFEAIPDTVKVEELPDGERVVSLTLPKALQVLGNQISSLIRHSELSSLPLYSLSSIFLREYGYALKPSAYECNDIEELVSKLSDYVQIANTNAGSLLVLVESESDAFMKIRIWSILLYPPYSMEVSQFISMYRLTFNSNITISKLEQMQDVCEVNKSGTEPIISLTPFYILAAEIYGIICSNNGQVQFNQLEMKYRRKIGKPLSPSDYNFNTLEELLSEMSFLIVIRGSRKRMSIYLNQQLSEYGIGIGNDHWKGGNKQQNQFQWPPTPAYVLMSNGNRSSIAPPPKPDTPPAPGAGNWSQWNSPTKDEPHMDLIIKMPVTSNNLLGNPTNLFSPTKSLLPITNYSFNSIMPAISAPDPSELPMPDKLLGKSGDDSNDSGVINNSHLNSESEMEILAENGAKGNVQDIQVKGILPIDI